MFNKIIKTTNPKTFESMQTNWGGQNQQMNMLAPPGQQFMTPAAMGQPAMQQQQMMQPTFNQNHQQGMQWNFNGGNMGPFM